MTCKSHNIVYYLECDQCGHDYVGMTTQALGGGRGEEDTLLSLFVLLILHFPLEKSTEFIKIEMKVKNMFMSKYCGRRTISRITF